MSGNTKGSLFNFCFKCSSFFTKNAVLKVIGLPVRISYRIFIQYILGIDIPDTTTIGKNFNVFHGQGLVINNTVVIGDNVTVRHNTTIGNARPNGGCPVIGNNVEIGANCVLIGEIKVGNNSIIAAGSVVIKDVPENVVVAGNPAKIVKTFNS
jgi:colanic acid biosynthesis acetyltransferase WcaB